MIRCGLCNHEVDDWNTHKISEEHIKNLGDKTKLTEAFNRSQGELLKLLHEENEQGLEPAPLLKKRAKKG